MTLVSKQTTDIATPGQAERSTDRPISRRLFSKRLASMIGAGALVAATGTAAVEKAAAQSVTGQDIANFALQYNGYAYVWAGNTPAGFDCSGFTQYIILSVLGVDIAHSTELQMNYGYWVDWGNWAPGDLVYFAGTWGSGISHTGVYIGESQFIHAENESTGVRISSLYSGYYSGHYYGAIRMV